MIPIIPPSIMRTSSLLATNAATRSIFFSLSLFFHNHDQNGRHHSKAYVPLASAFTRIPPAPPRLQSSASLSWHSMKSLASPLNQLESEIPLQLGKVTSSSIGEILSMSSAGFAVVRLCQEEAGHDADVSSQRKISVSTDVNVNNHLEISNEFFDAANGTKQPILSSSDIGNADGELTGRTVTFSTGSQGLVVAHRHPIAFILVNALDTEACFTSESMKHPLDGLDGSSLDRENEKKMSPMSSLCSISTSLVTINPESIPPGSIVDYMGRQLKITHDGSITYLQTASAMQFSDTTLSDTNNKLQQRPIFMPIPKISHIGLIDSPLFTGITAIDALTPLGKGQNMLVIGNKEDESRIENETLMNGGQYITTVSKRGWMITLLKSVIENNRLRTKSKNGGIRCFYALTDSNSKVQSNFFKRLKQAGIQNDIVTFITTKCGNYERITAASTTPKSTAEYKAVEAAEAVAAAASACTLGEHHALTTGGDALVIIDDLNLHKSLWDITTQKLVEIYGVNAVVKADLQGGSSSEMRGYFSGLIQRAARFNAKRGGGSVTLVLLSTLPSDSDSDNSNDESNNAELVEYLPSDFDCMTEKIKTRIATLVKAKVPLTSVNLRKIQIPLPYPTASEDAKRLALQHIEDLISMSDGQIWLDDKLANSGRSPPVDPSRSITRVGVGADTNCRADAPALRSLAGSLRFEFQQATDILLSKKISAPSLSPVSMATTSASTSSNTRKQVTRRDAFLLAMYQIPGETRKLSQECISLIAATNGHLDRLVQKEGEIVTSLGREVIKGLLTHVENEVSTAVKEIDDTLDMTFECRTQIEESINSYFAKIILRDETTE